MITNAEAVALPSPQEACLLALRLESASVPRIAMAARLSVKKAVRALAALESSGLSRDSRPRQRNAHSLSVERLDGVEDFLVEVLDVVEGHVGKVVGL